MSEATVFRQSQFCFRSRWRLCRVFTFVIVVHWVDTQRKEREAFYKTETLRRITEASGEGAKAAST